jgi:tRNA nucleotidyltransferase (CCA-adding enzyme)
MSLELAKKIAKTVVGKGGRAYFVGGTVRDRLLGIEPKDFDIEVYGIEVKDLQDLLSGMGNVNLVGDSFGVFKVEDVDVAVPRKERSTGRSHKTIEVDSDPSLDLESASRRRDFTVNAMLEDVLSGEVFDFWHGKDDLRFGIIRMVDESTFVEDPLRMLRAAKFASRLGYIISYKTVKLIQKNASYIKNEPLERIFGEISNILMKSPKPSYGFGVMDHLGLLEILLPEIWVLRDIEQNPIYHPEGNVMNHTYLCVDYEPIESRTLIEQLARLWHDVGKLYGSKGHEEVSAKMVRNKFPIRLTNDNDIINGVANIVENHMKLYNGDITRARVKRIAANIDVGQLVRMTRADKFSRIGLDPKIIQEEEERLKKFLDVYEEVQHEVARIMLGRDIIGLMPELKPGPIFKEILDEVYQAQLDDLFSDHEGGVEYLKTVLRRKLNAEI